MLIFSDDFIFYTVFEMDQKSLKLRLLASLKEDSAFSDVTTRCLPSINQLQGSADVIAKGEGVFCGAFLLRPVFSLLDPKIKIKILRKDGQVVRKGTRLATLTGKFKAILAGERVFLNLACHLSGISSLTREYVKAAGRTSVDICDTRKTMPLWRDLERFAVRCGGGVNHRFSLGDAILVKDNHLAILKERNKQVAQIYGFDVIPGGIKKRVSFVEIEATTLEDVWQAIKARADMILLDNMADDEVRQSMDMIRAARRVFRSKTPLVEVSGGVTLESISKISSWGVDRISVGAITHSVSVLDLSLEVK